MEKREYDIVDENLKDMLDVELADIQVSEELITATLYKIEQVNVKKSIKHYNILKVIKVAGGVAAACMLLFVLRQFSEDKKSDSSELYTNKSTAQEYYYETSPIKESQVVSDVADEESMNSGAGEDIVYKLQVTSQEAKDIMLTAPSEDVTIMEGTLTEGELLFDINIMDESTVIMEYLIYEDGRIDVASLNKENKVTVTYQAKDTQELLQKIKTILGL